MSGGICKIKLAFRINQAGKGGSDPKKILEKNMALNFLKCKIKIISFFVFWRYLFWFGLSLLQEREVPPVRPKDPLFSLDPVRRLPRHINV